MGDIHELLVVARFSDDNINAETLSALIPPTIKAWAKVWQSYRDDIWEISGQSPCEKLGIDPSSSSLAYVTVQNMNHNGLSVTVHSNSNGHKSLNSIAALTAGIDAYSQATNDALRYKNSPYPQTQTQTQVDDLKEHIEDEYEYQYDENQGKTVPTQSEQYDFTRWRQAIDLGNNKVQLPMAKSQQIAFWATDSIDFNNNAPQYAKGRYIAYEAFKIESVTVGKNALAAVYIHTTKGRLTVFMYQKDGKTETYDFQTVQRYIEMLGIDALEQFKVNGNFLYCVKIAHTDDATREFKNAYGLWQLPIKDDSQATEGDYEDADSAPGNTRSTINEDDIPF
jgi:hypothetical protein